MLQFQTNFSLLWVLVMGILVLGVTGWLEFKRQQKYLVWRLIAAVLAVTSLTGLILKPSIQVHKTSDYILLTDNYNPQTLDSLTQHYSASQLYQMPGIKTSNRVTVISNYRDLSNLRGNIHVLGDGLPAYMLGYLDTTALHYYPSPLPEGFININLRKPYKQHQVNLVEGTFQSAKKSYTLKLIGSGKTEDSLTVTGNKFHSFALKFSPKISGNLIYTLTAVDSTGVTVYSERIPVQVTEHKPLSVLVLSNFPSAEIRFLKNYLEAEKHQLTLRYGISKNTYRTEFINTPRKGSVMLNTATLANYDLVILDAETLSSLPDHQAYGLKQATKTGLGIITLLNEPTAANTKTTRFLEAKAVPFKNDTATITLSTGFIKTSATPLRLESNSKTSPILSESSGRIVAGYQPYGLGKLGFQLLTHTYRLQLAGEKETYAELWANLLEETARQELLHHSVNVSTPFPVYEDEPLALEIISSNSKPEVELDSIPLPLLESKLVSNVWQANTWAGTSGWHYLTVDEQVFPIFISNDTEGKSMRIAQQQQLLKKLSGTQLGSSPRVVHQPIAPIIFYFTFLIAAGFLWLAPKL